MALRGTSQTGAGHGWLDQRLGKAHLILAGQLQYARLLDGAECLKASGFCLICGSRYDWSPWLD